MLECHLTVEEALPLVCLCSLLSFLCGVGIGGNDLSANFAMVVGSGSLNMKQAIVYCVVFELLGAFFMGGNVSRMIRHGIVDSELFQRSPDMVVGGMTCATFSAALWLYLSTALGLPVSITHTVVGSVLGFAIFSVGSFDYVRLDGLQLIVASWVVAPVLSAIATALLFWFLKTYVLGVAGRSFANGAKALPYCMFLSLIIDVCFVFIEQPPILQRTLNQIFPTKVSFVLLTSLTAIVSALANRYVFPSTMTAAKQQTEFCWESELLTTTQGPEGLAPSEVASMPSADNRSEEDECSTCSSGPGGVRRGIARLSTLATSDDKLESSGRSVVVAPVVRSGSILHHSVASGTFPGGDHGALGDVRGEEQTLTASSALHQRNKHVSYGATTTVAYPGSDDSVQEEPDGSVEDAGDRLAAAMNHIHYGGTIEVRHFNPMSEYLFTVLQVLAGAMSSFVHGAVAGANATATFMILYETFSRHYLKEAMEADGVEASGGMSMSARWSILPAMFGIAIGMVSLGARLMKTVGVDLVTVTPARGWAMQVGGTLITMICTALGIPVSLSQCQIGAAIGCGVTDAGGRMSGVSWKVVLKIIAGWVVTLVIGSMTTGLTMRMLAHFYCGMQFNAQPLPTALTAGGGKSG